MDSGIGTTRYSYLVTLFYFLMFYSFLKDSVGSPAVICVGGKGKCNGNFKPCGTGYLKNHSLPIANLSDVTLNECKAVCTDLEGCRGIVYSVGNRNCSLYQQGYFVIADRNYAICVWECCKDIDSCHTSSGRCKGYWVKYPRKGFVGGWKLSRQLVANVMLCLHKCHRHPLCGYVNFNDSLDASEGECQLFKYNPPAVNLETDALLTAYEWYCCPYDDSDIDSLKCKKGANKCEGKMVAEPGQPKNTTRLVLYYHTRDKLICLDSCKTHPYCTRAFYNQVFNYCMLKSEISREEQEIPCDTSNSMTTRYRWHGYRWKCCNESNKKGKTVTETSPRCQCFSGTVLVAANDCDKPNMKQTTWMVGNQTAFWVQQKVNKNGWHPFYNGFMNVWVYMNGTSSNQCDPISCHIFSTFINASCPRIVKRDKWFARQPVGSLIRFPNTPIYAGISDTGCPVFGCYSFDSCSSIIRNYQYYHQHTLNYEDIIYNFIITSDGLVYEGRGADYISGDPESFRSVTMIIGFLGKYGCRTPSIESLQAGKQLCWCLKKHHNISADFQVYPFSRLTSDPNNPGRMLTNLLQNWPHHLGVPFHESRCIEKYFLPMWLSILVYGVAPSLVVILISIMITIHVRVWRHQLWCPRRTKKPKCSTVQICEFHDHDVLVRHLGQLPPTCVVRDCHSWRVSVISKPAVIIQTEENCDCAHHLHLMWIHCFNNTLDDFPQRVANSKTLRRCRSHTLLGVWADRPFILHALDQNILFKLISAITANSCVCRRKFRVIGNFADVPDPETFINQMVSVGWSQTWMGWMQEDVGVSDPRKLQRIFVEKSGRLVELLYGNEAAQASIVNCEEHIPTHTDDDTVTNNDENMIDSGDERRLV